MRSYGGNEDNIALGQQIALEKGIIGEQWECFYLLGMAESGWRTDAKNPSSPAYGIPQAYGAEKMKTHGDDYLTNPATQIRWMIDYVGGKYGTFCNAYNFQRAQSPHWY